MDSLALAKAVVADVFSTNRAVLGLKFTDLEALIIQRVELMLRPEISRAFYEGFAVGLGRKPWEDAHEWGALTGDDYATGRLAERVAEQAKSEACMGDDGLPCEGMCSCKEKAL